MSIFAKARSAADTTSREYLAIAPPGPRTEVLAAACAHRIRENSVAAAAEFGSPLTVAALAPASAVVRELMEQDRDLSAWVARKSMVHLSAVVNRYMPGAMYEENMDTVFGAAGVEIQKTIIVKSDRAAVIPADDLESATAMASIVLAVFTIVVSKPLDRSAPGYPLYAGLYTDMGPDAEGLAYDIIAWQSVVLGRMANTGRITDGVPTFDLAYRDVPRMRGAGWYPNPPNFGGLVDGDARAQRFWDGERWTAKARVRKGRDWEVVSVPLHADPSD